MNENINENSNSENEITEGDFEMMEGETAEDYASRMKDVALTKSKAEAELKDKNSQLYARTKKAEGFKLVDGKWVKDEKKPEGTVKETPKDSTLSQEDLITIARSDIHEEDLPEVLEYAKFKGVSVKEALKSPMITTLLATKTEERKTAEATAMGEQRRGAGATPEGKLLADASRGILPESDADIARLAEARLTKK